MLTENVENQMKMFNGMPQAIMGKLGNGTATLEVYFINGQTEVFYFDGFNKTIIKKWIKAIRNTVGSDEESLGTTTEGKFDEIVSASTTPGSDEDCDWGMQQRIDNCSEPIVSFLHQIERLNLKNMSFLTSSNM